MLSTLDGYRVLDFGENMYLDLLVEFLVKRALNTLSTCHLGLELI